MPRFSYSGKSHNGKNGIHQRNRLHLIMLGAPTQISRINKHLNIINSLSSTIGCLGGGTCSSTCPCPTGQVCCKLCGNQCATVN